MSHLSLSSGILLFCALNLNVCVPVGGCVFWWGGGGGLEMGGLVCVHIGVIMV